MADAYAQIRPFGIFILYGLLLVGLLGYIIFPIFHLVLAALEVGLPAARG
jgi:hypothetical protein